MKKNTFTKIHKNVYVKPIVDNSNSEGLIMTEPYSGLFEVLNPETQIVETRELSDNEKNILEIKETNLNETNMDATTGKGTGLRFNNGKLRYDLVEPRAFEDFVGVLTDGANKYFDRNWENGLSWTSVLASLKRHIAAIEKGEDYDPESGRLHIAHAACNVHFLNAFYYTFPQGDDRPKPFLKIPKIGLDIDGVLADFTRAWYAMYPDTTATPKTWHYDRNIEERFEKMKNDNMLDNFYLNIPVLTKPEEIPFEPHCYITSRPVTKEITEKWLQLNEFPIKNVISLDIRKSKVDAAKNAGVDIFIDDNYDNFVELNNNDIFTYLFTSPYNVKYDVGHMRINSLKELPLFIK